MNKGNLPKLALIAGPTASGKSALAMRIAEAHGGVVINADSAQVYADLRVLSARPSIADEAKIPHRLFGYIDGAEACSAARWAADARVVIDETVGAGRLPVLVGGTGLYIRTLLDGIAPVPPIDPAVRESVRAMAVAEAHAALASEDPAAAARLAPADTTRVARALEVVRSTGKPIVHWQVERAGGIGDRFDPRPLILLPNRDWLFARIDARVQAMFDEGAIDEVATLLARADIPADAPIRRAIGVRPIAALLAKAVDRVAAIDNTALATRQYAKRQFTWFRSQPPPQWPRIECSAIDSIVETLFY